MDLANQSESILIHDRIAGYMSLNGHTRSRRREAISFQSTLAFAALFAFLVIRNAPPDFPRPPSAHHSLITVVSNHSHRPHFDSDGLQWSAPVKVFLPFPPAAVSAHFTSSSQLLSTLQTKGFHYNRPPPAC